MDIGCGARKRPGFLGVDMLPGADHVCDVSLERLPFPDGSVGHLFSSHCLEHIPPDRLGHVFREFTRVSAESGLLELWHPHSSHRDAFMFDHKSFLNEEHYYQPGLHPEHWEPILGARWVLEEVRFHVDQEVWVDLDKHGFDLDFAIQHLHSVVKEMGVFIRVVKEGEIVSMPAFRRTAAVGGRSSNLRELGGGPYRPSLRPNFTRVRRALARRFRRLLGG